MSMQSRETTNVLQARTASVGPSKEARMMTVSSSVGAARGGDLLRAAIEAATTARRSLAEIAPQAALVLTAGSSAPQALVPALRETLGSIPIAGGAVAGILTHEGVIDTGAAVMCFAGERLSPSTGCGAAAADLQAATERAGRLILSGSVSRRRYPRGLALAFTREGTGSLTAQFLAPWRTVMGPKLRNICSAVGAIYASEASGPGHLAVLCLEGHYQSGFGLANGYVPGEVPVDLEALVHGAADAASTAVKRLDGQPVRGVLVAQSAARHAVLGPLAQEEWMAVREQVGADVPMLGWLTSAECGCGHGTMPSGETGSLIVVAFGDAVDSAAERAG
jgi:FIST N domain